MKIAGLQKLTLLDYPGKVACIIFTPGCDFRCPFCHNASLVTRLDESQWIPMEQVITFLKKRRGILDGVCITGGEPLLQAGIEDFLSEVKGLGYQIKLDTNGSHPEKLKHMISQGLVDYVAMDVKNSFEKYEETIGIQFETSMHDRIQSSIQVLVNGTIDFEFRTTIVDELHDADDFIKIGEMCIGARRFYIQKFEDSGDLVASGLHAPTNEKMQACLSNLRMHVADAAIRGD